MSDPKVDALGHVPMFAGLSRKEREFLASQTDEVKVPAGKTLIRQGQASDAFYLLLEGEAAVEQHGRPRPALGPGSFFGEISMMDRGPATATVTATTLCRLAVMSHAQFRDAVKANDHVLLEVLRVAAERLRRDELDRDATR